MKRQILLNRNHDKKIMLPLDNTGPMKHYSCASYLFGRRDSFIIKLMQSYFFIIFVWVMTLFVIGFLYFSKLMTDESIKNNSRILQQFSVMTDDYILGNMKDIAIRLYENCQKEPALNQYMTQALDNNVVDTLAVRQYLSEMLAMNPAIESLALYYPQADLLVTNYVIRYPQTEGLYMGGLLTSFRDISRFDGQYKWVADGEYQVLPASSSAADVSGAIQPYTVNAMHFMRKVPSVNEPGKTGCVLFVTIREEYLYAMLQTSSIEKFEELIIVDEDGIIASHTRKEMINKPADGLPYGQLLLDAACESVDHIYNENGIRRVVSVYRSNDTGWVYASISPVRGLSSLGKLIFQVIGLTILLASAAATAMSVLYARRLYRPLGSLTQACIRLMPHMPTDGLNEYQLINSTIDSLNTQVKKHRIDQEKNRNILKQEYLRDFFYGGKAPIQPVLDWLDSLGITFPYGTCCAFIVQYGKNGPPQADSLRSRIAEYSVSLESKLNTGNSMCVTGMGDNTILIIMNYDRLRMGISDIAGLIATCGVDRMLLPVYIFNGDAVSQNAMHLSAMQARQAAAYHFLFPELSSIRYADISPREESKEQIDRSLLKNLSLHLRTQDHSKALTSIDSLVSALRDSDCSLENALWALRMTNTMIEDAADAAGMRLDESGTCISDSPELAEDVFKYKKMLIEIMNIYFRTFDERHSERNRILINEAKEYIQQNINSTQLSLNDVADFIGISASHFSRIFKREAGMSFLDYITDYKLDYCRQLLITTDTKIEQITGMLGYSTPQYLANRFKIKYGCSPKEYRFRFRHSKQDSPVKIKT